MGFFAVDKVCVKSPVILKFVHLYFVYILLLMECVEISVSYRSDMTWLFKSIIFGGKFALP